VCGGVTIFIVMEKGFCRLGWTDKEMVDCSKDLLEEKDVFCMIPLILNEIHGGEGNAKVSGPS